MLKQFLNQPFPLSGSRWRLIIAISLFIGLFMLFFRPFGIASLQSKNIILICAGYGLVTFVVLVIDLFLVQFLCQKWFEKNRWTVGKQIIWLMFILFTIGIGNYLYSSAHFSSFSFLRFIIFQFYTLLVGIIPIVVLTIVQMNIRLTQNLKSAQEFNNGLIQKEEVTDNVRVSLIADNEKDKLELEPSDLLYIESSGNYIEVFYLRDGKLKNTILRSTLKRTELQVQSHPSIQKCHRAFLVNINKIVHVRGNSQGLKLVLKNTDNEIPVSRNFSKSLREKLNS